MTSSKDALQYSADLGQQLLERVAPIALRMGRTLPQAPTREGYTKFVSPDFEEARRIITAAASGSKKSDTANIDKLQGSDLVKEQIATEKAKIEGAKGIKDQGRHFWDDIAENLGSWGTTAGKGLATGAGAVLSQVERPARFLSSATYELQQGGDDELTKSGKADEWKKGANLWSNAWSRGLAGFFDEPKQKSWEDIIAADPDYQGMSGGWQKSALKTGGGLAASVAYDPVTYVLPSPTALGEKAAVKAVEKIGTREVLEAGVKGATQDAVAEIAAKNTVKGAVKKVVQADIDGAVQKQVAKKTTTQYVRKQAESLASAESKDQAARLGSAFSAEQRAARVEEIANELTDKFRKQVTEAVNTGFQRRLGVKVAGHDLLSGAVGSKVGRATYKPFELAGAAGEKVLPIKGLKQAFQMGEHFPGLSNTIRRISESRGIVHHEATVKKIKAMVKGLTNKEEEGIFSALEAGARPGAEEVSKSGKNLGEVYDAFDQLRRHEFSKLVDAGVYEPGQEAANYVPMHMRGGSPEDIKEFKDLRKRAIQSPGSVDPTKVSLDAAKQAGLKPYTKVSDAFREYNGDVTRKLVRRNYNVGLVNEYGTRVKRGADKYLAKRGMVNAEHLMTPADRKLLAAQGETMMMPKEMVKTVKNMNKLLANGNPEELNRLLRLIDRGTNAFKRTATVYSPSNWVNNSIGDMTMNFFDGVTNPLWYERAAKVMAAPTASTIKIGGVEFDGQTIRKLYDQYSAGAGFLHSDVTPTFTSKLTSGVGKGFQAREDVGRIAHFLHALDEEVGKGGLKGLKKIDPALISPEGLQTTAMGKRLARAADAAGKRVSKWNIDYSEFTPFERKLKKFIPFYSFQRKAIPLILEAAATKPGRYLAIQKAKQSAVQQLAGDPTEGVTYPDWLRQAGFMRLTGGKEPWVLQDPLPTNVMGKNFGQSNFSDFLLNQVATLHPLAKIPLELAFQKQAFTGQKLPENMAGYWMSQVPPINTFANATGVDPRNTDRDINTTQRIMALAGMKPYKVTDKAQAGELQRQKDPYDAQMSKINNKLKEKHIEVRQVKGGYKIGSTEDSSVNYGTYADPSFAYRIAVMKAGLG